MARTERVAASDERDAMLREPGVRLSLKPADVRQYLAADALSKPSATGIRCRSGSRRPT